MKLELELAGTSSSSVIQTYSSSSSNSFPTFAPKMADGKGRDDTKLWPAALEKQLIIILMLEETKGNISNGQMKHNCWSDVVDQFNHHTNKPYSHQQIKEKFKRLKKRYNAFSQLIGTPGIEFDRPTNTVRGPKSAWLEAESWNRKCKEFRNKGLEHFDMLVQLFKTGTTSSAQPDSPDDVDEIPHPDMGQGSNRKGKLAVRSNTSTKKKRKAIDSIIETEFSKKRHSEDRTVESPDPYSISKATEIVNSMFGGPLGRSTLFKFLLMLKTPTLRETFITLQADMREAFIEYCCGSN